MIYLSIIAIWAWFSLTRYLPLTCFFLAPFAIPIVLVLWGIKELSEFVTDVISYSVEPIFKKYICKLADAEKRLYGDD